MHHILLNICIKYLCTNTCLKHMITMCIKYMYTYAYSGTLSASKDCSIYGTHKHDKFSFSQWFCYSGGLFSSFTTSPIIWTKCMHWYIRMYTRFYNQNKLLLYKSYVSKTQLRSANPSKSADSQTQAHFLPSFLVCLAVCWSCFCLFLLLMLLLFCSALFF